MGLFNPQMGLAVSRPFVLMQLIVLSCLCSGFPYIASSVHGGNETDQLALLAFKAKVTDGPSRALSSWNESIHFCRWLGVTCGRRHQRVIALDLVDRQLTGSISPHIGNMSFLRKLWLNSNNFIHVIPPEIGHLRRLEDLSLNNNSISGEIPGNISSCGNLVTLSLHYNKLEGKIPLEVGSLSKLVLMSVHTNKLIGHVPPSLGNLSSLQKFYATENSISGNIPDTLGQLTNLEVLALGVNRLFGTIPSSIFNLSSMTGFDVGTNQLHGSLPLDLGNTLSRLQFLSIAGNLFTGSIPVSISNASKLVTLAIAANKLSGKVPNLKKLHNLQLLIVYDNHLGFGAAGDLNFLSSVTNATNLHRLLLGNNNFGGVLPKYISNFSTNLAVFDLENNKIFGSIPTEIENLVNLEVLHLPGNQFTGNIPSNIGKLHKLQYLTLSLNKFTGKIPWSLGNLTLIANLYLRENNFFGSIPPSLGKCQNLAKITFSQNNLTGTIPPQVISLSTLFFLDLSLNHLTGSLPMEVGNLKNIEFLSVSQNMLSNEIPGTLGSCVVLRFLFLESNNFHGILPSSLSNLRGIEVLDFSSNNLSGKIPHYLGGFVFLRKLDLSLNDFEGEVPKTGIFKNASAVSIKGNKKLCGGIPKLQLPSCNSQGSKKKRLSLTLKLIAPIACGLLGLFLVFFFWVLPCFRKTCEVNPFRILGNPFLKLSYQSLLKATDGFSPTNLIGVGSFGSVYKGILEQGGKIVAVKVLNLQFHEATKSFKAECQALRSIKHRNLVKVLTACSSIDYQGNHFKALVYEFMVNGSLEKWLHPDENKGEAHGESRNLNLLQRLNIAVDVASALDYLHHHCPTPIAHCDLKPSNVLLDDEMTAHVGDFGLARFLPQATYDFAANQSSSIGLRGSVGYAAPEYGMGNEVSISGDVYSYGILLLEMFSGKKPTDSMFSDGLNLHNFAKMALPEQVAQIADPKLLQQQEEGEMSTIIDITGNQSYASSHKIEECLISLFRVGIACSEELPRDRLDIEEVLPQLHAIKNNLGKLELVKHTEREELQRQFHHD